MLLAFCAGNSPVSVNSPHKGQWRGALVFSLICVWINRWVNNHEAGDLRRRRAHYDVIVMISYISTILPSEYAHGLCFVGLWYWSILKYPSGLLHCHRSPHMIVSLMKNNCPILSNFCKGFSIFCVNFKNNNMRAGGCFHLFRSSLLLCGSDLSHFR